MRLHCLVHHRYRLSHSGIVTSGPQRAGSVRKQFTEVTTRGADSAAAALAMVFKLVESARQRWRAVNASHLLAPYLNSSRTDFSRSVNDLGVPPGCRLPSLRPTAR